MKNTEKLNFFCLVNKAQYKSRFLLNNYLVKLGLKAHNPLKIGINNIYNDDIFIVSYPKSGNTWLRFLIANLLNPEQEITFRNIEYYVPDIYKSSQYINQLKTRPRFIKTHDTEYEYYPKIVYIYRDGRDAAASFYYYLVGRKEFNGTFTEFLKFNPSWGATGWNNHVSKALNYGDNHPNSILFIKYEDLIIAPFEIVDNLGKFCCLQSNKKEIKRAIDTCKFDNLKLIENKYGAEDKTYEHKFFRAGTSGQWKMMFSDYDLKNYISIAENTLKRLNYI